MERPPQLLQSYSSSTIGTEVQSGHHFSADHLVHDPLCSGFLLKHCKEQFSDENMLFIVAVDRFRDYFHRDHLAWPQIPWKKLDEEYITVTPETETIDEFLESLQDQNFFPECTWPSSVVSRDSAREIISKIIREFLIKDADKWICISQLILSNTMKRIRLLHIYGQKAFSEALFDPVRTIERDTYPRFQTSPHIRRMIDTKQTLEKKAYIEKFKLPRPEFSLQNKYTKQQLQSGQLMFTLTEIIEDGSLYEEFRKYLVSCVSEENLKCIRAITIFKDTFNANPVNRQKKDVNHASIEFALLIYRYFVAPRAPLEICVSHAHINEILRGLADPYPTLFEPVERSAMSCLQTHFATFRNTPQYLQLSKAILSNTKLPPVSSGPGNRYSSSAPPSGSNGSRSSDLPSLRNNNGSGGSSSSPLTNSRSNSNSSGKDRARIASSSSSPAVGMTSLFGTCFPTST